jgi:hypothetical protein
LDTYSHLFVALMLATNLLLIAYALASVTLRTILSGVGLIDSLPIGLYLLPLMVFLPIMIRAFYLDRTAAWNFVFLMICTVFFILLSSLVRAFLLFLGLNLLAAVTLFLTGRFRPRGSLKKAGKKGLAYVLLLNMLGLTFPVTTVIMGQTPIASASVTSPAQIGLEVGLADFDFPYVNVTPTPQLLGDIANANFSLDLHVLESDPTSWARLTDWLVALNETSIDFTVTLTPPHAATPVSEVTALATTESLLSIYANHSESVSQLWSIVTSLNLANLPDSVLFDMTLSRTHFQKLMLHTRSLDLVGFSGLMRRSLYSVNPLEIQEAANDLAQDTLILGLSPGVLVEPFVVDDQQDGDTVAMRLCGQTIYTLSLWDRVEVMCSRSAFSYEMLGDVGEYMALSFARSVSLLGSRWSLRMGELGNRSDILGRPNPVYNDLSSFGSDLALAAGSRVSNITLGSLGSLLSSFGSGSVGPLRDTIDAITTAVATYTFRVYAFRAVFQAIDSFDFMML